MPLPLARRVSVEKSADSLKGVLLYVICRFSLVTFNILFLSFIFISVITVCLGVFFLGFILPGTLCASWTQLNISPFPCSKIFQLFSSISSGPFSLSCPSGAPIMQTLVHLMFSQRFLKLSSFLFILFSIFCSVAVISTFLSSRSFIHASISVIMP